MANTELAHSLDKQIYTEQIRLLYAVPLTRPALHLISLIILLLIIKDYVNPFYAYTWALLLIGLNSYRCIDIYKTKKTPIELIDYKTLHKRYAFCAGLLGALYGFGFVLFFDQLPILSHVYFLTVLALLTPAGLVSFTSDKLTYYLYIYLLMLPVIIRLFVVGQLEYFNFGICAIIFTIVGRSLFVWNHNVLTNAIQLKIENESLSNSLKSINERLTELSIIDELTQVANRRSLDDSLEKEWLRAKRMTAPISFLMIDIDYFKQYNDEFGHLKGDDCLIKVADYLKQNLNRSGDFIARYGGEEFCIIMPETDLNGAIQFAKNIQAGVRDLKIDNPGSEVSKYLTVSIGVASVVPDSNDTYMDLIYTSDKALYKAKNDGRNIIRTSEVLEKITKPHLVV